MYDNNIKLFNKDSSDDRLFVKFPNLLTYKEEIIEDLINKDQYIFETCTTCESTGEDDFCGRCNPCRNLKACFNNILSDN
jgi:7-cyano-7-deazaguanine synthase in queuosine biosynthesis